MSAFPNLAASPEPPDELALAPVAPPGRSGATKWIVTVVVLAIFAAGAAWVFLGRGQERQSAIAALRTVRAVRGSLGSSRRIAGSIFPGRFANIAAPILQSPDAG